MCQGVTHSFPDRATSHEYLPHFPQQLLAGASYYRFVANKLALVALVRQFYFYPSLTSSICICTPTRRCSTQFSGCIFQSVTQYRIFNSNALVNSFSGGSV